MPQYFPLNHFILFRILFVHLMAAMPYKISAFMPLSTYHCLRMYNTLSTALLFYVLEFSHMQHLFSIWLLSASLYLWSSLPMVYYHLTKYCTQLPQSFSYFMHFSQISVMIGSLGRRVLYRIFCTSTFLVFSSQL